MYSFLAKWWGKLGRRQTASDATLAKRHDTHKNGAADFDAAWYLSAYPDVAAAGIDPWLHYQHHGKAEGRLPYRNRALAWDHALWRGASSVILPRLVGVLNADSGSTPEQHTARWALARWYAWQGRWDAVIDSLMPAGQLIELNQPGPALLVIDACCREPNTERLSQMAPQALAFLEANFPHAADTSLARSNVLRLTPGPQSQPLAVLNALFHTHDLAPLALRMPEQPLGLDNLAAPLPAAAAASGPLISVVVPLYNAELTIATALRSLFAQQEVRLEIIVVDDASQDGSVGVVEALQQEAPEHVQLLVVRHFHNQGAYAARNTGMAAASGEFLTTHDSDDWSHPQKLQHQVQALIAHPEAAACLSHWVRVTPALHFHRWRLDEYGWVYPNMSSLMLRRTTFDALGYWDLVSVNADTEWRLRVEAGFGTGSVLEVLPGVPLAFGLADEGSLSQHANSHLISQFSGARFRYMQMASAWHSAASEATELYMPRVPEHRLFCAPLAMLREDAPRNERPTDFERVCESTLFDPGWYLTRYIDLQQTPVEPLLHYWESGAVEGRDPGPNFSSSGYRRRYSEVVASTENPLAHFLREGHIKGYAPLPIWEGKRVFVQRPTVMLCAHQAGVTHYGAERSLLDVLEAFSKLRWNVVVTLPEANNEAYEQAIMQHCCALAVLPYGWWQVGKPPVEATVSHFEALIHRYSVKAVHGNTSVLHEPYVAAKRAGIPALVHVRELPKHDEALCELLGATPEEVVSHVHAQADILLANSQCVAKAFALPSEVPVCVVPNTIHMPPLLALPPVQFAPGERVGNVRVGMLSSNVAKKGIDDLEAMAGHLQSLAPFAIVVLYGARSPEVEALLRRQAQGRAPANIRFAGYVERPEQALAELDIVVNLSRFQESFGRTVLEAMAAGRPVVAYRWGALEELIVEGETGYLVPYGEPYAAAKQVALLAAAPAQCRRFGQAAQRRAETCFSSAELVTALARAYRLTGVSALTADT